MDSDLCYLGGEGVEEGGQGLLLLVGEVGLRDRAVRVVPHATPHARVPVTPPEPRPSPGA